MYIRTGNGLGEPKLSAKVGCPGYEKGEIEKSRCQQGPCQQGHLLADVIRHPRGLLIADFGVGSSGIKDSTKKERLLRDWLGAAKSDLHSIILRIYGYSDCVGKQENNVDLRHNRAKQVYALLDKDLQSRVDFIGPARPGEYVADNKTREGRAKNRGVIIELSRFQERPIEIEGKLPPSPIPPHQQPRPVPAIVQKPKPVPDPTLKPTYPGIRWRPPGVTTSLPPSDPSGPSWVWGPIGLAATALGTAVSIGVRRLSNIELATAIEAAWLIFQIEQGGLRAVIGLAGEAAAEAFIGRVIGSDAARIFNLNNLVTNFPMVDLIAPTGLFSVKTKGLLGTKVGAVLDAALIQEYTQDLIDLALGGPKADKKLAKAASLLFNNRGMLQRRGSWPTGFKPRSVADMELYVRRMTALVVPHDHVQLLKRHIGSTLYARLKNTNIRLPAGTAPVAWVNSFVDRIHSMGITSSDLNVLLEATKYLPKEQVERLHRELAALMRRRRSGP